MLPFLIREMKTKTTMRYHYTPTTLAKILTLTITSVRKDVEQQELFYTSGENINYNYLRNKLHSYPVKLKVRKSHDI